MLSKDIKKVQTTRAWTGLIVVIISDIGIALAAILVAIDVGRSEAVAILTSAFTAITAISTAYFGVRAATNTAQSAVAATMKPSQENDAANQQFPGGKRNVD
ncbi:hypothetical protein AB0I00_06025 [Streptomyces sp. NPDC050803]|uniref:hypothetical protein n=1 Tax=unclassified Streptomyces TaxID=2593676 RepID=UPI00341823A2